LGKDSSGKLVRKAGVMGIVKVGGRVSAGDSMAIELPDEPFHPLKRV
ncbi:MOSC domain-containing protein, partial [Vibrio sp. S9_S30]|nr:MOSC domain-containing protein [Vibrio sp. S9_S30]